MNDLKAYSNEQRQRRDEMLAQYGAGTKPSDADLAYIESKRAEYEQRETEQWEAKRAEYEE